MVTLWGFALALEPLGGVQPHLFASVRGRGGEVYQVREPPVVDAVRRDFALEVVPRSLHLAHALLAHKGVHVGPLGLDSLGPQRR